jgi:hypothetical protein
MPNLQLVLSIVAVCLVAACDQISPSRYEITRDQSGRTLRLDKRTGEIAVVEGERIAPIRDANTVQAEQSARADNLAKAKAYPALPLNTFGFEATLRTSWQDGKLLYFVRLAPKKFDPSTARPAQEVALAPSSEPVAKAAKRTPIDWSKFERHTWTLLLEDAPFELAKETLTFTGVVDDDGKIDSREAKGSIAMSSESYRRVDSWNVMWRPRF